MILELYVQIVPPIFPAAIMLVYLFEARRDSRRDRTVDLPKTTAHSVVDGRVAGRNLSSQHLHGHPRGWHRGDVWRWRSIQARTLGSTPPAGCVDPLGILVSPTTEWR